MPKIGDVIEVKVVKLLPNGAILTAGDSNEYFMHIKDSTDRKIKNMEEVISEGESIKARIVRIKKQNGKTVYQLSLNLLDENSYNKELFNKKMKDFMKKSSEIQRQVRVNKERKQIGRKNQKNQK